MDVELAFVDLLEHFEYFGRVGFLLVRGHEVGNQTINDGELRPANIPAPVQECLILCLSIKSDESFIEHFYLLVKLLFFLLYHFYFLKVIL